MGNDERVRLSSGYFEFTPEQKGKALDLVRTYNGDTEFFLAYDDDTSGVAYFSLNSKLMNDGRVMARKATDSSEGKVPVYEEIGRV